MNLFIPFNICYYIKISKIRLISKFIKVEFYCLEVYNWQILQQLSSSSITHR